MRIQVARYLQFQGITETQCSKPVGNQRYTLYGHVHLALFSKLKSKLLGHNTVNLQYEYEQLKQQWLRVDTGADIEQMSRQCKTIHLCFDSRKWAGQAQGEMGRFIALFHSSERKQYKEGRKQNMQTFFFSSSRLLLCFTSSFSPNLGKRKQMKSG